MLSIVALECSRREMLAAFRQRFTYSIPEASLTIPLSLEKLPFYCSLNSSVSESTCETPVGAARYEAGRSQKSAACQGGVTMEQRGSITGHQDPIRNQLFP